MQWLLSSTEAASRPVLIARVLHLQSVLIFFIFRSRCLLKDYVVVSLKLHVMTRAQWRNSLKLRLKANIYCRLLPSGQIDFTCLYHFPGQDAERNLGVRKMKLTSRVRERETKHSCNRTDIIGHRTKAMSLPRKLRSSKTDPVRAWFLIYVLSFYLRTKLECIMANSREFPLSTGTERKKMFRPWQKSSKRWKWYLSIVTWNNYWRWATSIQIWLAKLFN